MDTEILVNDHRLNHKEISHSTLLPHLRKMVFGKFHPQRFTVLGTGPFWSMSAIMIRHIDFKNRKSLQGVL